MDLRHHLTCKAGNISTITSLNHCDLIAERLSVRHLILIGVGTIS